MNDTKIIKKIEYISIREAVKITGINDQTLRKFGNA